MFLELAPFFRMLSQIYNLEGASPFWRFARATESKYSVLGGSQKLTQTHNCHMLFWRRCLFGGFEGKPKIYPAVNIETNPFGCGFQSGGPSGGGDSCPHSCPTTFLLRIYGHMGMRQYQDVDSKHAGVPLSFPTQSEQGSLWPLKPTRILGGVRAAAN